MANDDLMLARLEKLPAAVLADVLDGLGYRDQTLGPRVGALTSSQTLSGRVFTAQAVPVSSVPDQPYQLEMEAIDRMQAGDVLVVDGGFNPSSAFWGELLSTACVAKGVRGVVMSAYCRDIERVAALNFPVFGAGLRPTDSLGRIDVVAIGEGITIDGVSVECGDWIVGDRDGVTIVPAGATLQAIQRAEEKVAAENGVREDLAAGMSVVEAFRKHGVL